MRITDTILNNMADESYVKEVMAALGLLKSHIACIDDIVRYANENDMPIGDVCLLTLSDELKFDEFGNGVRQ